MILKYKERVPQIAESAYVPETCTVAGNVKIHAGASIWPYASLRGDMEEIIVGEGSNVQDNVTVHTDKGFPAVIGAGVSIGHNAVIHGCTIGDNTLIGMGAVILNGARIGKDCIVGAGAVVRQGMEVPDGSMVLGLPASVKRPLRPEEIEGNRENAREYSALAQEYRNQKSSDLE